MTHTERIQERGNARTNIHEVSQVCVNLRRRLGQVLLLT